MLITTTPPFKIAAIHAASHSELIAESARKVILPGMLTSTTALSLAIWSLPACFVFESEL
jgi:hypothetical protein